MGRLDHCQNIDDETKRGYYTDTHLGEHDMYEMKADYEWFQSNRNDIIAGHRNESVVIRNKAVLGYYTNDGEALEAMKDETPGTYIIQRCIPAEDDVMYYYTGRYAI